MISLANGCVPYVHCMLRFGWSVYTVYKESNYILYIYMSFYIVDTGMSDERVEPNELGKCAIQVISIINLYLFLCLLYCSSLPRPTKL